MLIPWNVKWNGSGGCFSTFRDNDTGKDEYQNKWNTIMRRVETRYDDFTTPMHFYAAVWNTYPLEITAVYIAGETDGNKAAMRLTTGNVLSWSWEYPDPYPFQTLCDIFVDDANNMYMGGDSDVSGNALHKFNSSDVYQWGYWGSINTINRIIVDGSGNIYYGASGLYGRHIVKLDSTPSEVWYYSLAAPGSTSGSCYDISIDASGNVYAVGYRATLNKSVWKLNSSGVKQWDYDTGANAYGVAVDDLGNVYVAGARIGNASVWKFNSSGALQWTFDTGANAKAIAISNDGNIHVVGNLSYVYDKSVFVLDSSGNLTKSFLVDSALSDVVLDSNNYMYLSGQRGFEDPRKSDGNLATFYYLRDDGQVMGKYDSGDNANGVFLKE